MTSCALPWDPERIRKAVGEMLHTKGSKVWLVKEPRGPGRVTVNALPGRPFGRVAADSMYPDLWVSVRVTNKDQWIEFEWREREYARWKSMGIKPGRIPWRKRL